MSALPRLLLAACLLGACAHQPGKPQPQQPERAGYTFTVRRAEPTTLRSDSASIRRFQPRRQAELAGGECVMKEKDPAGSTRMVAHFPNLRAPRTSIVVLEAGDGRILRYSEERGVARPSKSFAEIQAQLDTMRRTSIQLDYVRNTAMAVNRGPGEDRGVQTTIGRLLATGLIEDLPDRIARVRQLCALTPFRPLPTPPPPDGPGPCP